MRIYLIGYMGVGKSTVGKRLSVALGVPFADLDSSIEASAKRSVSAIFSHQGEAAFRKMESDMLRNFGSATSSTPYRNGFVLATGGGTPCQEGNIEFMLSTGLVVWLQLSPKGIANRLLNAKTKRPLLRDVPDDELHTFVAQHLAQRKHFYEQAQLTLHTENLNAAAFSDFIDQVKAYSR